MRRILRALSWAAGVALLAGAAALIWWHAVPDALAARFALSDCRRVALKDAATGAEIRGVEDMARLPDGRLVLSAYDRLGAAAAIAEGRRPPEGGLYLLDPARLDPARLDPAAAAGAALALEPLIAPGVFGAGLHPHGIAVSGGRLWAVNRRLADPAGTVEIAEIAMDGSGPRIARRILDERLCAANDLARWGGGLLVTIDRGSCPGFSVFDMVNPARGRAVAVVPEGAGALIDPAVEGLAHPNGVHVTDAGPVIAETRGGRLRLPDGRSVGLPGGPDNLTGAPDGRIVAALHPSLLRLALHRHGWAGAAPSRVVAADPATGAVEILLDDPEGRVIPGATVAHLEGGRLVIGAAVAPGIAVCEAA